MMKRTICASVMSVLLLCGCGDPAKKTTPGAEKYFDHAATLDVSAHEYRVNPPDELTIRAPGIKEMDSLKATIRPDGKISLNLLGEVVVAGKTPQELGKMLTEMANKYYNSPDVRVEVTGYNSKFYYFFGEVGSPGKKPYTGRDTVVSALAEAGFTPDSWPQQVYLNRQVGPKPDQSVTMVVDMKKVYMTGDVTQNYLIKENDILSVRRRPLAEIRQNMEDIVGPITGASGAATAVPTPTGKK